METSKTTLNFIRFGELPVDGKSWNSRDEHYESGVSVFHAIKTADGWEADPKTDAELATLLMLSSRDCYLVTGNVIGTGSDGEPVLENAKVVELLKEGLVSMDRNKFDGMLELIEEIDDNAGEDAPKGLDILSEFTNKDETVDSLRKWSNDDFEAFGEWSMDAYEIDVMAFC